MEQFRAKESLWGIARIRRRDVEVQFEEACFERSARRSSEEYVEGGQVGRGVRAGVEEIVGWEFDIVKISVVSGETA